MKVLLIDIDSKIPNLALMKIASYHKSIGDEVGFNINNPDMIYASVIFNKNRHLVDGLHLFYPNSKIDIGGSGYDVKKTLPKEIEECMPDYSIYPNNDTAFGFTTRGCIRHCYFCIVHDKEGTFRTLFDDPKLAMDHITNGRKFDKIQFLDNNILANKEWFMKLTDYIIETNPKMKVDFNQGLDVRLLDDDIARQISKLKPLTKWKFAYDDSSTTKAVLKGIEILKRNNVNVRGDVMFYVYCHNDEQIEDAVNRCNLLKENGTTTYSMINRDNVSPSLIALSRWTRPWVFWSCTFDEYKKSSKTNGSLDSFLIESDAQ